jgi:hypothetical protein
VHVAKIVRKHNGKEYVSYLLRRTFREGGKVRHETVANISALPPEAIEALRASLAGKRLVSAGDNLGVARSLPHGHVAAGWAQAQALGLPELLGAPSAARDLVLALVIARTCDAGSGLATAAGWAQTTLAADLGLADAPAAELAGAIGEAMAWLAGRQEPIERALAARHLPPGSAVLYNFPTSAAPSPDPAPAQAGEPVLPRIEFGLMSTLGGCPVSVAVAALGLTDPTVDPAGLVGAVDRLRRRFELANVVIVAPPTVLSEARIVAAQSFADVDWITGVAPEELRRLTASGAVALGRLDDGDVAELTLADHPGERFILRVNRTLAAEAARRRAVAAAIAPAAPDRPEPPAEASLDGVGLVRTSVDVARLDAQAVVAAYDRLIESEAAFRSLDSIPLTSRPGDHLPDHARADVLVSMLAGYLGWHLRQAWAPLLAADAEGTAGPTFETLLDHLSTLTRCQLRTGSGAGTYTFDVLSDPTPLQKEAFGQLGAEVPLALRA